MQVKEMHEMALLGALNKYYKILCSMSFDFVFLHSPKLKY